MSEESKKEDSIWEWEWERMRMGSEFGEKEKGIFWVGGRGECVSGGKEGKVLVGNEWGEGGCVRKREI